LIYTGAAPVVIDEDIARQLGLRRTGESDTIHGFGVGDESLVYKATLLLDLRSSVRPSGVYGLSGEVNALPGIRARHAQFDYRTAEGKPLDVIGVIGRRLLRAATVIYDGPRGVCEIYLDENIFVDL